MKAVSYRLDENVIAIVDTMKIRGFGVSSTDVVRKAIVYAARAKPGELAEAWVEWLAKEPVVEPAAKQEPAAPEPACEVCGDAFASGNTRYCAAHRPAIED